MPPKKRTSSDPYQEIKRLFDRLAPPQKAAFLVEATLDTVGEIIETVGQTLAEIILEQSKPASSSSSEQTSANHASQKT